MDSQRRLNPGLHRNRLAQDRALTQARLSSDDIAALTFSMANSMAYRVDARVRVSAENTKADYLGIAPTKLAESTRITIRDKTFETAVKTFEETIPSLASTVRPI